MAEAKVGVAVQKDGRLLSSSTTEATEGDEDESSIEVISGPPSTVSSMESSQIGLQSPLSPTVANESGNDVAEGDGKLAGWLKLSGQGFRKAVKKFWFIYSDGTGKLYYYRDPQDVLPVGEIDLRSSSLTYDASNKDKPGVFEISRVWWQARLKAACGSKGELASNRATEVPRSPRMREDLRCKLLIVTRRCDWEKTAHLQSARVDQASGHVAREAGESDQASGHVAREAGESDQASGHVAREAWKHVSQTRLQDMLLGKQVSQTRLQDMLLGKQKRMESSGLLNVETAQDDTAALDPTKADIDQVVLRDRGDSRVSDSSKSMLLNLREELRRTFSSLRTLGISLLLFSYLTPYLTYWPSLVFFN
ncbi:TBC1 domain family member 2b [Plakobranchus ocellatus]|uniref:TBC1 domain family member 2b n=1 Tax=Plakobranchus ocellatus TaxID=259542 RepID=A0AAV3YFY7_9GAST|nr:TBC1 domain family member 2b [Plakobranchus ocellatus]